MADRGATWRDVEVKALLEVWSGELIQAQLAGAYRVSFDCCCVDSAAGTKRRMLHIYIHTCYTQLQN